MGDWEIFWSCDIVSEDVVFAGDAKSRLSLVTDGEELTTYAQAADIAVTGIE